MTQIPTLWLLNYLRKSESWKQLSETWIGVPVGKSRKSWLLLLIKIKYRPNKISALLFPLLCWFYTNFTKLTAIIKKCKKNSAFKSFFKLEHSALEQCNRFKKNLIRQWLYLIKSLAHQHNHVWIIELSSCTKPTFYTFY